MKAVTQVGKLLLLMAIASGLAVIPIAADATDDKQATSVRGLYEHCSQREGNFFKTYCFTYIGGFADGLMAGGPNPYGICIPDAATPKQLAATFSKWAASNPEKWHLSQSFGLVSAFSNAYGCD